MHIGWGKIGNLQFTRPYVTGRVLWGALTMRLTRDTAKGSATDSSVYRTMGESMQSCLVYTYFFPATKSDRDYRVVWPWEQTHFRRRLLSSFSGSALTYPQQTAANGMLHEVEFISPNTLDDGEPVFLLGYVFERAGCQIPWSSACKRLQLGGERGYGWGSIDLVENLPANSDLFDGQARFSEMNGQPVISVSASTASHKHLLAHAPAEGFTASGEVEPLVGREWRLPNRPGQHLDYVGICYVPGTILAEPLDFAIEPFGLWRRLPANG